MCHARNSIDNKLLSLYSSKQESQVDLLWCETSAKKEPGNYKSGGFLGFFI